MFFERLARNQCNESLAQQVLVPAIHGMRAPTARCLPSGFKVLKCQGRQR